MEPLLLLQVIRTAAAAAPWCYPPQFTDSFQCNKPSDWKKVSTDCTGSKQSPIDIDINSVTYDKALTPFQFQDYDTPTSWTLVNDGHSAKMNLDANVLITQGKLPGSYKAVQLHLHWGNSTENGAEHTINGKRSPMELHIVHMNTKYASQDEAVKNWDGLAVLGFLYREDGSDNQKYQPFLDALKQIPDKGNQTTVGKLSLSSIIPEQSKLSRYYRYEGSLTTPNCNEAVIWTLFEETIPLSKEQLATFYNSLYFPSSGNKDKISMALNYRPIQTLGRRTVYTSNAEAVLPLGRALLTSSIIVLFMIFVPY
ncbi:carbonic anhydrase 4 [Rhinatrema bivittatum]|uniref:carbonic anhydrase 4 n=1 Tax=Rhinatrema bivittatum TaxID=194408 RepID=UPI0011261E84|nr:carbonic anhydrase 4 [Rhinatrema bivittatum]